MKKINLIFLLIMGSLYGMEQRTINSFSERSSLSEGENLSEMKYLLGIILSDDIKSKTAEELSLDKKMEGDLSIEELLGGYLRPTKFELPPVKIPYIGHDESKSDARKPFLQLAKDEDKNIHEMQYLLQQILSDEIPSRTAKKIAKLKRHESLRSLGPETRKRKAIVLDEDVALSSLQDDKMISDTINDESWESFDSLSDIQDEQKQDTSKKLKITQSKKSDQPKAHQVVSVDENNKNRSNVKKKRYRERDPKIKELLLNRWHINRKNGNYNWNCDVCNEGFPSIRHLIGHKKSGIHLYKQDLNAQEDHNQYLNTSETPLFECECGYITTIKSRFKKHKTTDHTLKLICKCCSETVPIFNSYGALIQHYNDVHHQY